MTFEVGRKLTLADGINAVRVLLSRCWFDDEKCRAGLEALTFYRKSYNERTQEFTGTPVHDWASHGADAFRGLALRHKTPEKKRARYRRPFEERRGAGAGSRPGTA